MSVGDNIAKNFGRLVGELVDAVTGSQNDNVPKSPNQLAREHDERVRNETRRWREERLEREQRDNRDNL